MFQTVNVTLQVLTHSLTAALDQLRVVASSTSNDPGPRSRQHQQIGQCLLPTGKDPKLVRHILELCLCVLELVDEAVARWHGTSIQGHQYKKNSNPDSMVICEDPKSGGFGLNLHLEIQTHWWSRVSIHPGVLWSTFKCCPPGVAVFSWNSPQTNNYTNYI